MKKYLIILFTFLVSPLIIFAQTGEAGNAESLIRFLHGIINERIIPIFIGIALIYTIYAVVSFIAAGDDTKLREEKKQQILWGVIGLFVIVSIWGIISLIGTTFQDVIYAGGTLQGN